MENVIEIKNLSHKFKKKENNILRNINLEVKKGEFIAIVGKSGSGKSTLLNLIAGFIRPSEGEIKIWNKNIENLSEGELTDLRRERIGFIFQAYNLLSNLTVYENIIFPLEIAGIKEVERERMVEDILTILEIAHIRDELPKNLSGGEQQRVGIGRAIVNNASLILADEPTGNLDTITSEIVLNHIINQVKERNITLVMVTHDDEIAKRADRVIKIKDGIIL